MKTKLALTGIAFAAMSSTALAQYSIDWFRVAGGGGASAGAAYSLHGTIGQHDAGGPMTGGQFSISGGFWALPLAVQTAGAPTLAIAPAAPGFISISWSPNTPGFVLQEKTDLNTVAWSNSASGATNGVTVPIVSAARFYRLARP